MTEMGQDKPCGSGIKVFNIWNVAATVGNQIHLFSPLTVIAWKEKLGIIY